MSNHQGVGNGTSRITYGSGSLAGMSSTEYAELRRREYPNTHDQDYPTQLLLDQHNDYRTLTRLSKRKHRQYVRLCRREEDRFEQKAQSNPSCAEEMEFYRENRGGMFPDQHKQLVEVAYERYERSMSMASARDNYLRDHPYGYKNLQTRIEHMALRDRAYWYASVARSAFDRHYKYAGDLTNRKNDQYGRREPLY
ncbi:hypothetical protein FQN54_004405 [Arachnomyces sp. PD_36]|nr:hypothetical protein FQN54_004405 [Arachnomyces sp. PD_36]